MQDSQILQERLKKFRIYIFGFQDSVIHTGSKLHQGSIASNSRSSIEADRS